MARRADEANLPDEAQLQAYLDEAGDDFDIREASRYFGIRSKDRPALRGMVRKIRGTGPKNGGGPADVPPVGILDVDRLDDDGELIAILANNGAAFRLTTDQVGRAPVPGDRVLARLDPVKLTAEIIRVLPGRQKTVVGVVRDDGRRRVIEPLDRGAKTVFEIFGHQDVDFKPGDLVRASPIDQRSYGTPRVKVTANLGAMDEPRSIGRAMAHRLEIPTEFPQAAIDLAKLAKPVGIGKRTDLRDLPLVTIDGADARDFDDAVFAEPDGTGYRIVVAIADVAHYVRPGDALDREAAKRGNSVYFPDHAIPMLPEELSNDLCSLRPHENRACLAVDMTIDASGQLKRYRFARGLMRSAARLTYEQMQAALDGTIDDVTGPLLDPYLRNLEAAYRALLAGRAERGTLDLDLPERMVIFDEGGRPVDIGKRVRLDSHKLIEEMMIQANVAAARALGDKKLPFLYRVHDRPEGSKIEALADYLDQLGVPFSKTAGRPQDFTRLIERIEDVSVREIVSQFVLRCQAQAVYQPDNIGHFGLHLRDYAHYTSPIRRYSDLLLHRALIRAFGLGEGGLPKETSAEEMAEIGNHLSTMERRAMEAERRTMERMVALVMQSKVGASFSGRITGAQRFGLFVALDDSGAEGLVPVSMLGDDRFYHDERYQALVGEYRGEIFAVGDRLQLELLEVQPAAGSLVFKIIEHRPGPAAEAALKGAGPGRGRGGPQRYKAGRGGPTRGKPGRRPSGRGHSSGSHGAGNSRSSGRRGR